MRGEEFLTAMEQIDPALIEEAEELPGKTNRRRLSYAFGMAAAACLVVLITLFLRNGGNLTGPAEDAVLTAELSTEEDILTADSGAVEDSYETAALADEAENEGAVLSALPEEMVEESADADTAMNEDMQSAKRSVPKTLLLPADDARAVRFLTALEEGEAVAAAEADSTAEESAPENDAVLELLIANSDGTEERYLIYENGLVASADAPGRLVRIDGEVYDELLK